jgi:hypothetical protein
MITGKDSIGLTSCGVKLHKGRGAHASCGHAKSARQALPAMTSSGVCRNVGARPAR